MFTKNIFYRGEKGNEYLSITTHPIKEKEQNRTEQN
jgi:hypothetical protein